jgi:hypothetical protein
MLLKPEMQIRLLIQILSLHIVPYWDIVEYIDEWLHSMNSVQTQIS